MIDWVTFTLPYDGRPFGDVVSFADVLTGVERARKPLPQHVKSSYSTTVAAQAVGQRLYVSGNPAKFLSGQNVYGSDDLTEQIIRTTQNVLTIVGMPIPITTLRALRDGDVMLHRVDCTYHYHVGDNDMVNTWLAAVGEVSSMRYRGRGMYDEGMQTVTYGIRRSEGGKITGSRRSSLKFYNKFQEMGVNRQGRGRDDIDVIRQACYGHIRAEAMYRGLELKRLGLDMLRDWDHRTCDMLHNKMIDALDLPRSMVLSEQIQSELPRNLSMAYKLWQAGEDMRTLLTKSTYYRFRREMMKYDIDISVIVRPTAPRIMPVIEVLTAGRVCESDREKIFWLLVDGR